ncbi:MAG: hypothetical protein PWP23_935 [Candidatus Sumerlaeota bacterium]|nr:hypothetical protein [Candidatus Sumerlaeota bacterium]
MMSALKSMNTRQASLVFVDVLLLSLAWVLAYLLRFEFTIPSLTSEPAYGAAEQMLALLPWVVLMHVGLLFAFGLYRTVPRYVGTADLKMIGLAALGHGAFWLLFSLFVQTRATFFSLPPLDINDPSSHVMRVPFGVLGMYFFISIFMVGGFRFSRRLWSESRESSVEDNAPATLIVGAGDVAETALREILRSAAAKFRPVCAVATTPNRVGTALHGIPVEGRIEKIPELLKKHGITTVLIALDEDDPAMMREIVRHCQNARVAFHMIPALRDIAEGRVEVRPVRAVKLEDLLGREAVRLQLPEDENYLRNETVLITGAGGSIGSELARQVLTCLPKRLVLLGKGENSIHEIRQELQGKKGETELLAVIADVRDRTAMERVFEDYRPTIVFHAAAHKHVDLMEAQPEEAIKNNVLGTAVVAFLAKRHKARRFVLVSSDKAVRPAGVMGASKRLAELVAFSLAADSETIFQAVRFGNVLGSRGSATRTFERQIAAGGPVTVTHPDVSRYFMTVPEAVSLLLQAGRKRESGLLFLLEMGEPVRIVDLVRQMITLSGLSEGIDVELQYTGLRPGEKLHEDLVTSHEGAESTGIDKVKCTRPRRVPAWEETQELLATLQEQAESHDREGIYRTLREAIPDYHPAQLPELSDAEALEDAVEEAQEALEEAESTTATELEREISDETADEVAEEPPRGAEGDQPDLFAEETAPEVTQEATPDQPGLTPGEPGAEEAGAQTVREGAEEAEPALPAGALAELEGGDFHQDPAQAYPSVEIEQPGFPQDAPETGIGRLDAERPENEPDKEENASEEESLNADLLSGLEGETRADEEPHYTREDEIMSATEGKKPFVFLAILDGVGAEKAKAFLDHLATRAEPDAMLITAGLESDSAVPESLRARTKALPADCVNPPARWNAALALCPEGAILCSVVANLILAEDFVAKVRGVLEGDEQAVLTYVSHIIKSGDKEETVIVHQHEGCPHERFEFGPVMAYKADALRQAGGFDESLKYAWEYDAQLRLLDNGVFLRVAEPVVTVVQPAKEESQAGGLYSPGAGPLGGFSYVFYPAEMDKEVTGAFEKALKRWGAWIDHETLPVPQPATKPEVMASVVIPVLNRVRFIGNAIQKVLEGTFQDFEVIVVDNGSKDGTIDVVNEIAKKDPRVRLLHGKGSSIASALNEAIKASRGKYICQLDSDDQYAPTTLEKMVGHLESHPKCGLAISYYRLMDENANVIEDVDPITHSGYSRNQILRRDGAGALRVFPKAVLEEFGYYDEEHYGNFGEDYDMVVKTGEKYDVDRVHEVLYFYRRHGDNTDVIRDPEMKYKNKNRARQEALRRRIALNRQLKSK